jgi:NAD+ diphosphatase
VLSRAAELRKNIDHLERMLQAPSSLLLPTWRDLTLVTSASELGLLEVQVGGALVDVASELVFLGLLEHRACFALDLSNVEDPRALPALAGGGELQDLRAVGASLVEEEAAMAAYARALLSWHRRHRFCGACGAETAPRDGGHVRVCRDPGCATQHFPRTDPAVIMLVHDGDRCLLGRQRGWPKGLYSTLAGFVEPGETMEQAVAREVREESGVAIADARYFKSQPWPFPASLMIGFFARATSTAITVDGEELEDAAWFDRAQLADPAAHGFSVPTRYSLASKLIDTFARNQHARS